MSPSLDKYKHAKSISSDAFFEGRDDGDVAPTTQTLDTRANLDKYKNAKGISSDAFFERTQDPQAWGEMN